MIDLIPQNQNVCNRDQDFMKPRPRPRSLTARPRLRPKGGFETKLVSKPQHSWFLER